MDSLGILIFLIAVCGFFALTEMSLAASRKSKLRQLAEAGDANAARVLLIKETPSRFLAATQTGLTAASLLAGIFGESALATHFESGIEAWLPAAAAFKAPLALFVTITVVTAFSIVFGEIIPKRIALAYPEKVAQLVAPFMTFFIWALAPVIRLLSWSADLILRLLPLRSVPEVTGVEDILAAVDESQRSGSIGPEESHLLGNVVRLEDRRVAAAMTPARDVAVIDLLRPHEDNLDLLRERPHGRYPVCRGDLHQLLGLAESRALLKAALAGEIDFAGIPIAPPLFVPSALTLIELLRTFRTQRADFAFVVNEFGQTEGVITLGDLLQTVAGDMMPSALDPEQALAVQRSDGSWLLDGLLPLDELREKLEIRELPESAYGSYHTVGGFVIAMMARIPKRAEKFSCAGWEFEVVDMDRNRVDEVLATRVTDPD
jgi:putative hemolysin